MLVGDGSFLVDSFFREKFGVFDIYSYFCSWKIQGIAMARKDYIDILKTCSTTLREEFGILSLQIFGSVARNEQRDDSDVDLFVETKTPNPFLLMEAKEFLETSTGRHVDIVRNHRNLNPRLRKRIEKDGIVVF